MRKILPVLFVLLFSAKVAFAATVVVGWTNAMSSRWQTLKNQNHKLWQRITAESDSGSNYNTGLREAILYRVTGNPLYANRAYGKITGRPGSTGTSSDGKCIQHNSSAGSDQRLRGVNYTDRGKGCMSLDELRQNLPHMALTYSWVADGLDPTAKANFADIMKWQINLAADTHTYTNLTLGVRANDTDQLASTYWAFIIYALAIAQDDPSFSSYIFNTLVDPKGSKIGDITISCSNSDIFKLTATTSDDGGCDQNTWRNAIAQTIAKSSDGQWLESTVYNLSTLSFLFSFGWIVESHLPGVQFPELYEFAKYVKDSLINEVVPDQDDAFMWGDLPSTDSLRGTNPARRMTVMSSLMPWLNDDPQVAYMANLSWTEGAVSTPYRALYNEFYLHFNPLATQTAPSGITYSKVRLPYSQFYLQNGAGAIYWHSGWTTNDSAFYTIMNNRSGSDHDPDILNMFELWRNGDWAITNPRLYPSSTSAHNTWVNGLLVNGYYGGANFQRGEVAEDVGSNYVYQVGATGGFTYGLGISDVTTYPPVGIKEWSRTNFYRHNANGSDTVIISDRVTSKNPYGTSDLSKYRNDTNYLHQNRINGLQGKHQIIANAYNNPTVGSETATWTGKNGETIRYYWDIQNGGYTTNTINLSSTLPSSSSNSGTPYYFQADSNFSGMSSTEKRYQLRIIPDNSGSSGFESNQFWQIYHIGTTPTITYFEKASGETARGVLVKTGSENVIYIANATPATDYFDPNLSTRKNPSGFNQQLAEYNFFDSGYRTNPVTISGPAEVYLANHNVNKTWTIEYSINAGTSFTTIASKKPNTSGLLQFNLNLTGSNNVIFRTTAGGSTTPPDPLPPEPASCGDGTCNGTETCSICPSDCGACCGNKVKDPGEECDLGINGNDADGCTDSCKLVTTTPIPPPAENTLIFQEGVNGFFGCEDTNIEIANPGTNYGTDAAVRVKDSINNATDRVTLTRYRLSGKIPSNYRIDSVDLEVYSRFNDVSTTIYMYEGLQDWTQSEATWNKFATESWGEPGARGDQFDIAGTYGTSTGALASMPASEIIANQWGSFSSNPTLVNYVRRKLLSDGELNFVFHDKLDSDEFTSWQSCEASSVAFRPRLILTYTVLSAPECGNGDIEPPEQCDDQNLVSGDGCTSECLLEYCGDATCNNSETCSSCPGDCGGCCGNGVPTDAGENCDDGNTLSGDGCSSTCQTEICGDATCNAGESCTSCPGDCGSCCGNRVIDVNESCDDGANGDNTDGCNDSCQIIPIPPEEPDQPPPDNDEVVDTPAPFTSTFTTSKGTMTCTGTCTYQ